MASQSRLEALKGTPEINYGEECCSICLQEFTRGEICRVLPRCGHMFHKECIDQWLLNRSPKCPVCRRQVVVKEKPRKARKRLIDQISLDWILVGAAATSVVIVYGCLAYTVYEYCNAIKYTCDCIKSTIDKLCQKGESNSMVQITKKGD